MAQRLYNFHASDATRESILLRAGLCGPTGSGKTKTGLMLGTRMVERLGLGPLFVIDSENKSALRYAYSPRSKQGYKFKHVAMPEDDYGPAAYMAALDYCEAQGAGVILIDSLSHAWNGINGVLEQVDQVTGSSRSKNAFSEGWKTMTPVHNRLIQRMLGSSAHVIFTLRAKVDWVVQPNDRGKMEPQKLGMAPIQREGVDYEPDIFADFSVPDNAMTISKSRCDRLAPGERIVRPGVEFADVIIEWVEDSEPPTAARTLGEAVNQAVAEGILAAEEKSADRYKEAKRKLIAWCEQSGVSPTRRDVALGHFKERVSVVAGPKNAAPAEPALSRAPLTATDAVPPAAGDVPGAEIPGGDLPQDPSVDLEFKTSIDRMVAGTTIDEVRAGAALVYKRLAHHDSIDGQSFRASFEANMQRFVTGWTIAGAEKARNDAATEKTRVAAAAAQGSITPPVAPGSVPGAQAPSAAAPQGGAPAAAQPPPGAAAGKAGAPRKGNTKAQSSAGAPATAK